MDTNKKSFKYIDLLKPGVYVEYENGLGGIIIPTEKSDLSVIGQMNSGFLSYLDPFTGDPVDMHTIISKIYGLTQKPSEMRNTEFRPLLWERPKEKSNEQLFRELWKFRADHVDMDDSDSIRAFCKREGIACPPRNNCFACEATKVRPSDRVNCDRCPIFHSSTDMCSAPGSIYQIYSALQKLDNMSCYNYEDDIRAWCRKISELPWKDEE